MPILLAASRIHYGHSVMGRAGALLRSIPALCSRGTRSPRFCGNNPDDQSLKLEAGEAGTLRGRYLSTTADISY